MHALCILVAPVRMLLSKGYLNYVVSCVNSAAVSEHACSNLRARYSQASALFSPAQSVALVCNMQAVEHCCSDQLLLE